MSAEDLLAEDGKISLKHDMLIYGDFLALSTPEVVTRKSPHLDSFLNLNVSIFIYLCTYWAAFVWEAPYAIMQVFRPNTSAILNDIGYFKYGSSADEKKALENLERPLELRTRLLGAQISNGNSLSYLGILHNNMTKHNKPRICPR